MNESQKKSQAKLKMVRARIEAILKDHDVAAYVTLHAPGMGEVFWNIWPSYSILRGDLPEVRIVSKRVDYPSDEAMTEAHAQTAQMIRHIAMTTAGHSMQFLELSTVLDAKLGTTHTDDEFIPDPSKMNPGVH